jgi:hypothetical protein
MRGKLCYQLQGIVHALRGLYVSRAVHNSKGRVRCTHDQHTCPRIAAGQGLAHMRISTSAQARALICSGYALHMDSLHSNNCRLLWDLRASQPMSFPAASCASCPVLHRVCCCNSFHSGMSVCQCAAYVWPSHAAAKPTSAVANMPCMLPWLCGFA